MSYFLWCILGVQTYIVLDYIVLDVSQMHIKSYFTKSWPKWPDNRKTGYIASRIFWPKDDPLIYIYASAAERAGGIVFGLSVHPCMCS